MQETKKENSASFTIYKKIIEYFIYSSIHSFYILYE